jgi:hypothetical protein
LEYKIMNKKKPSPFGKNWFNEQLKELEKKQNKN